MIFYSLVRRKEKTKLPICLFVLYFDPIGPRYNTFSCYVRFEDHCQYVIKSQMNIELRPFLVLYLAKTFLLFLHISFYFAKYPLNWFLVGEHLSSC